MMWNLKSELSKIRIERMTREHIEKCTDLFIDVFTKEPWNDTYDSRTQVINFFNNYLNNNYFVGFILKEKGQIIAMSLGMKKPWINGMEYYIDQFCVQSNLQNQGNGSHFLKIIESMIQSEGMNAIMLNTEKGFPSERFYLKNGFRVLEELVLLVK